jgi:hypothetical protein
MDFKFVIEKKTNVKDDGTLSFFYYLRMYNDTTWKYGKIINIFTELEEAKIFLDKIKDIYPEPERKVETIYTDGYNIITIEAENEIDKYSLKPKRAYAIFNRNSCIKVINDDYELAIKEANQYVEKIKYIENILIEKPEIVLELTINK